MNPSKDLIHQIRHLNNHSISLLSILVGLILLIVGAYALLNELGFVLWVIPYVDE